MASRFDMASGPLSSDMAGEAFRRPLPPKSDDLMILARDDVFYWLRREAYQTADHVIPTSMVDQAKTLVEQGVVLADIPVGSIPGVGCMCYLVNLSGIRRSEATLDRPIPTVGRQVFNPPPVDPKSDCLRGSAPAMDDLVIVDRQGKHFYWVKKCEYQRTECRLDLAEPILEEQVRLLTNQGVVLADVPGGSLLGVDDMGCLVNLSAIHRLQAKVELSRAQQAPGGRAQSEQGGQP